MPGWRRGEAYTSSKKLDVVCFVQKDHTRRRSKRLEQSSVHYFQRWTVIMSELLELVWLLVEPEALDEALLLLLLLLLLALQGSSFGFDVSFSGILLCSWLVDATLWDFLSSVWFFIWGQSGFSRASSGLKEMSAMMPLSGNRE